MNIEQIIPGACAIIYYEETLFLDDSKNACPNCKKRIPKEWISCWTCYISNRPKNNLQCVVNFLQKI